MNVTIRRPKALALGTEEATTFQVPYRVIIADMILHNRQRVQDLSNNVKQINDVHLSLIEIVTGQNIREEADNVLLSGNESQHRYHVYATPPKGLYQIEEPNSDYEFSLFSNSIHH